MNSKNTMDSVYEQKGSFKLNRNDKVTNIETESCNQRHLTLLVEKMKKEDLENVLRTGCSECN